MLPMSSSSNSKGSARTSALSGAAAEMLKQSANPEKVRYVFRAEFFDERADLVRPYNLFYFVADNTIEMFDLKNRRTFLKRCPCPTVSLSDLFIGSVVVVYSRQLKIVDYGDAFTRNQLGARQQKVLAVVQPEAYESLGLVVDALTTNTGLSLAAIKLCQLTPLEASSFLGLPEDSTEVSALSSGYALAIQLVGENGLDAIAAAVEGTEAEGKQSSGQSVSPVRALLPSIRNPVLYSKSEKEADRDCAFFFGSQSQLECDQISQASSEIFDKCTCCVIRPHAVQNGQAGQIIDAILAEGYEITRMCSFTLDPAAAKEFLEVYNTVVPEYNSMVQQLCTGRCIALAIRSDDDSDTHVVTSFRDFCGPADPEIGKLIRPSSLRARFGHDRIRNAVHCTDLPDDGDLECEYFFSILASSASSAV